jgi:hypothetical protein
MKLSLTLQPDFVPATSTASRKVRDPLKPENVYCHRCSGYKVVPTEALAKWNPCPICEGTGQVKRQRFPLRAQDATGGELIECRLAVGLDAGTELPSEIMVMPGGLHEITPMQAGKAVKATVKIEPQTAAIMQDALEAHLAASPQRPFFDFDHEGKAASAWPQEFFWRQSPAPGVYARVEWSQAGADAVKGRTYRAFSPSFFVDSTKANPARVTGAPIDMGSLVNRPAFKTISPLWAKAADAADPEGKNQNESMTPEELAALQARLKLLEKENAELKAQAASSANDTALRAKDEEIAQLKQSLEKVNAEIKARNKSTAEAAVKAAVARGVIAPKDEALQARWTALIETDPTNEVLLANAPVNPALKPVTTPAAPLQARQGTVVTIEREDSQAVLKAYGEHYSAAISPRHGPSEQALQAGLIYQRDIAPRIQAGEPFPLVLATKPNEPIQAANAPGTLVGPIVMQRALDLLQLRFPVLSRIARDFSSEEVKFNQTVYTRTIAIPTVVDYNTVTGYANSDVTDTDVPVVIDKHKGTSITFNANDLASTDRDLFGEHAEAMMYALAKNMIDALYAILIAANYTGAAIVQDLAGFARATVIKLAGALSDDGVPDFMRTLLLIGSYYDKLGEDTTIVSVLNNAAARDTITTGVLPEIHGFLPVRAPNLPNTGNMTGFALFPNAVAIASRLPNDYTKAFPGADGGGVVRVVTNPKNGMSVSQVQFINHTLAAAFSRSAWMFGVAKGDIKAGRILKSI